MTRDGSGKLKGRRNRRLHPETRYYRRWWARPIGANEHYIGYHWDENLQQNVRDEDSFTQISFVNGMGHGHIINGPALWTRGKT